MLRPIQELIGQTVDSISKELVSYKKEQLRTSYLEEDWATAILIATELLELPISMVDKEQAIWTKRKAGEHLASKCYL